jgi:hypothetical protein
MPERIKWSIRSNVLAKFDQTFEMEEKVQGGKENRGRFLHAQKSHKRPFSMKLWNVPFTRDESLSCFVSAPSKIFVLIS